MICDNFRGCGNRYLSQQMGRGMYDIFGAVPRWNRITINLQFIFKYLSMKIPIKNRAQNIEEPLKSPRRMTPELSHRPKPFKKYEPPQLSSYVRSFRKEIQLPINYESSIFLSKTPQRCLNHNNVITLFCLDDKKPLCAHCMYQAFSHKKHEVVPINKATSNLREQLRHALQTVAECTVPKISHFIGKNDCSSAKTEKEMKDHILLVAKFYQDLSCLVNAKKHEHLRYCQQLALKCKYEFSSFSRELAKTLHFVQEKSREIAQRNSEEHLLFNHNTAFYLSKVDGILTPQIGEPPALQIRQVQDKMNFLWKQVSQSLNFDYKLVLADQRRRSLERVHSLPRYEKFTLWKSKSPEVHRHEHEDLKKPAHNCLSNKQMHKAPFTQREHFDKNRAKRERKDKDKPSFITQHIKRISEESFGKQQSTLNTNNNKVKSKLEAREVATSKEV